jgi:C4-dicarboxylate-specific signal transduction histidine kinase
MARIRILKTASGPKRRCTRRRRRWLGRAVPDLGEARAAVERIIRDGQRASAVIRRIRTLATKADPHRVPLDLNEVIHEVVQLVHREVLAHRVELRTALAPAPPRTPQA